MVAEKANRCLLRQCGEVMIEEVVRVAMQAKYECTDSAPTFETVCTAIFSAVAKINTEGSLPCLPASDGKLRLFAELVNRAVFLDVPDEERPPRIEGFFTATYLMSYDGPETPPVQTVKPNPVGDAASVRAERQAWLRFLVESRNVGDEPWSYGTLLAVERGLGVCLPAEIRVLVLTRGWIGHLYDFQCPLRQQVVTDFVGWAKHDVPVDAHGVAQLHVDVDQQVIRGFLCLGQPVCLGPPFPRLYGRYGVVFIGVAASVRDVTLGLGTEYCTTMNEWGEDFPDVQICPSLSQMLMRVVK